MLTAAVVLGAVVLAAALVILSRRGGGEDLIGAQLKAGPPARTTTAAPPARLDDAVRRQVEELALLGRRLRAIDLVRTATGCTMAEAKALVDSIPRSNTRTPATSLAAHDVYAQVRELIRQGRHPEAVLYLHETAGLTLAKAEAAIRRL